MLRGDLTNVNFATKNSVLLQGSSLFLPPVPISLAKLIKNRI